MKYERLIYGLLLMLVCFTMVLGQNNYSVTLRTEDFQWRANGHEWFGYVYADIYLNGNLISPSSNYYYEWFDDRGNPGQLALRAAGYGVNYSKPDGHPNEPYNYQVKITGPNFYIISFIISIGKMGTPKLIKAFAKKEDGTNIVSNNGRILRYFTNPHWANIQVPDTETLWLTLDGFEHLWTDTTIVSNPKQKFHHWNLDETSVTNYHLFQIETTLDKITSQFKSITTATVRTDLISSGQGGILDFKDPWLADGDSLGGIPRSRGINARWQQNGSPLIILPDSSDKYKGVFLNQNPQFLSGSPVYSVRAPLTQVIPVNGRNITGYFQG